MPGTSKDPLRQRDTKASRIVATAIVGRSPAEGAVEGHLAEFPLKQNLRMTESPAIPFARKQEVKGEASFTKLIDLGR